MLKVLTKFLELFTPKLKEKNDNGVRGTYSGTLYIVKPIFLKRPEVIKQIKEITENMVIAKHPEFKRKIKATYCGIDGENGYVKGQEYLLGIKNLTNSRIMIADLESANGTTTYSNILTLLEDWTNIKSI